MVDKELIREKLKKIQEYFSESDFRNIRTLERNFQLIVDEMLDINLHIIKSLNLKGLEDFQSSFEILGENKILPYDFALKISPVVGLRNKLVYRYEEIERGL